MPLEFPCPSCGQQVSAPDSAAGVTGPCPHCGAQITAPSLPGQPATLVGPAPHPSVGPGPGGGMGMGGPGVASPTGRLDMGAIFSEAWRLVTSNAGLMIGGFVVIVVASMLVSLILRPFMGVPTDTGGGVPRMPSFNPLGGLLSIVLNLALQPLGAGLLFISDQLLTRGQSDFSALFLGYRRFVPMVLAGIVMGIAIGLGLIVLLIPGIWIATGLCLTQMEIVDRGASAGEALQASWNATAGNRLTLFLMGVVIFVVLVVSAIPCGLGLLVTGPWAAATAVIVYRELRGLEGRTE